ncbi:MAG: gliding motility-associated C-terminal domain-containing protein [Bacteroidota bacterium]
MYIPNIFSPNGDGANDVLFVRGQNIQTIDFRIYNRWGNQVFATKTITQGWDGTFQQKECEVAVYYWVAEIGFTNGEVVIKKGDVSLVR